MVVGFLYGREMVSVASSVWAMDRVGSKLILNAWLCAQGCAEGQAVACRFRSGTFDPPLSITRYLGYSNARSDCDYLDTSAYMSLPCWHLQC
eukprot:4023797-Amphidinium_carterae.1